MSYATRLLTLLTVQVLFGFACGHAATIDVGKAVMVRNDVKDAPPSGEVRQLAVGDSVALGHSLAIGKSSAFRMSFDPKGDLVLGPNTKLTVDQPLVDKATGRTTSKFSIGVGWMRLEVGELHGSGLEINTPSAVIGIKGTLVHVFVDALGETTVIFEKGAGSVKSNTERSEVAVLAGFFVIVPPGKAPSRPLPINPSMQAKIDQAVADAGLESSDRKFVVIGILGAATTVIILDQDDDRSGPQSISSE